MSYLHAGSFGYKSLHVVGSEQNPILSSRNVRDKRVQPATPCQLDIIKAWALSQESESDALALAEDAELLYLS